MFKNIMNKKILLIAIGAIAVAIAGTVIIVGIHTTNNKNKAKQEQEAHDLLVQDYTEKLNGYYEDFEEIDDQEKISIINNLIEEMALIKDGKLEEDNKVFTKEDYKEFEKVSSEILSKMNSHFDNLYSGKLASIQEGHSEESYNSYLECKSLILSLKDEMINDNLVDTEKVLELQATCDSLSQEYLNKAKDLAKTSYITRIDEIKNTVGEVNSAKKSVVEKALQDLETVKNELSLPEDLSDVSTEILTSINDYSGNLNTRLDNIVKAEQAAASNSNNNNNNNNNNSNSGSNGGSQTPSTSTTPSTPEQSEEELKPTRPIYTDKSQMDTSREIWESNYKINGEWTKVYFYVPQELIDEWKNTEGANGYYVKNVDFDSDGNPLLRANVTIEDLSTPTELDTANTFNIYYFYCDGAIMGIDHIDGENRYFEYINKD